MTGETKGNTDPWIERHEVAFPYAFDPDLVTMDWFFGKYAFPSAVLLDPQGVIVWKGHPSSLKEETIEKALRGALPVPLFELGGYTDELREELQEERYAQAYARVAALESQLMRADLVRALDMLLERRLADVQELFELGDYLAVVERCERLQRSLGKLPQREAVDSYLRGIKGDRSKKKILDAQRKVLKLIPTKRLKSAQRLKVIKELGKIRERFPDTAAARDAQHAIARLSGG